METHISASTVRSVRLPRAGSRFLQLASCAVLYYIILYYMIQYDSIVYHIISYHIVLYLYLVARRSHDGLSPRRLSRGGFQLQSQPAPWP